MLHLNHIEKRYADGTWALKNINLHLRANEIIAFVGANGSGKSTLLNILAGLTPRSGGTVLFQDKDLGTSRSMSLRRAIAYVTQDQALDPEMTGREIFTLFAHLYGLSKATFESRLALLSNVFLFSEFIHKPIAKLSGGQRQRIHLAVGFLQEAKLLLFDEPSTGLDPSLRQNFWTFLMRHKNSQRSIIVATHDLTELEHHCDRVFVFSHGTILKTGTPSELLLGSTPMNDAYQTFSDKPRSNDKIVAGSGRGMGQGRRFKGGNA